jgi:hypothetical protein
MMQIAENLKIPHRKCSTLELSDVPMITLDMLNFVSILRRPNDFEDAQ